MCCAAAGVETQVPAVLFIVSGHRDPQDAAGGAEHFTVSHQHARRACMSGSLGSSEAYWIKRRNPRRQHANSTPRGPCSPGQGIEPRPSQALLAVSGRCTVRNSACHYTVQSYTSKRWDLLCTSMQH
ncbi:hypothetical protein AOLI_G00268620 [Acnodon oligacanthus]